MIELAAVATITILAVISPGADFAMVTRNSILYGRSAGLLASLGIALGVQLHVLYTMLGVGLVLQKSPGLFSIIKLIGAVYLVYVGYKTFFTPRPSTSSAAPLKELDAIDALRTGFFTNALNPKTTLFVVSVYTQIVQPETSIAVQVGYGLFMSMAHWVWFSLVTVFFSEEHLRSKMLRHQLVLNRMIGIVLASLGFWLALSPR